MKTYNAKQLVNKGSGDTGSATYLNRLRDKVGVNDQHYRVLEIAEHVIRKVETDIFIAKHSKIDNSFEILSQVCDRYSGWLNDDILSWEFIDGSIIGWDRENGVPYLAEKR